ncbi:melibiose:sodium transporter MelB [Thaumasiovibrio sp. DFM-14]|uniref:melibiose:sodium transporter MelB n=1 Tax=Thaumasiovibrio sp. DFM-14 TaxID=3384792 RepID=UPI0039A14933
MNNRTISEAMLSDDIPLRTKISYGLAGLGKDMTVAVVMIYAMYYYTDIIGLAPALIGTLFFAVKFWDAINDPVMGMLVDTTESRFGRIKGWLLGGAILNSVLLVALFSAHHLEGSVLIAYVIVTYILWGMAFTMYEIPFWCILPNIAKTQRAKEGLVTYPRTMISIAWLIIGSFFLQIANKMGGGNETVGITIFVIVLSIFFLISAVNLAVNFKENVEVGKKEKTSFKDVFKILKSNDQFLVLFAVVLSFFMIVSTVLFFAIYYFTYVINSTELFALFMLVAGISEVVMQLLVPKLLKLTTRENLTKLCFLLPLIGCAILAYSGFFAPESKLLVATGSIIIRAAHGIMLILMILMLSDCIDYGEYKTGLRSEGIIFSAMPMQFKFGQAIVSFIMGVGLSISGYVPNVEQSPETIAGMQAIFFLVPIAACLLSYVIYTKFYKLKGDYLENYKNMSAERQIKEEVLV